MPDVRQSALMCDTARLCANEHTAGSPLPDRLAANSGWSRQCASRFAATSAGMGNSASAARRRSQITGVPHGTAFADLAASTVWKFRRTNGKSSDPRVTLHLGLRPTTALTGSNNGEFSGEAVGGRTRSRTWRANGRDISPQELVRPPFRADCTDGSPGTDCRFRLR